ncbi:MAG: adenosylcobinamide-phosphate synthase CbiB [Tissierellaceae bacterium]|nr:adenosylcobinamide-phosphate synthase CbiB [Tissierellaceae bacterium]
MIKIIAVNILLGSALDFLIGDPYNFPHPVRLMGKIISFEERIGRRLAKTRGQLKLVGFIMAITNIIIGFFIPYLILKIIRPHRVLYNMVEVYFIYTCIAARSLDVEATKVYKAFDFGLDEARVKLSYIVGRETHNLSETEVIKGAVETVSENTSDGVIAPLLYIFLFGASGGFAYKFINTMDSMVGYMNDKYIHMGYFPAKIDDIANYVPARLTGLLMILTSYGRFDISRGFRTMLRDRKKHKSPNSAYPESAVAGLLGIELGGGNYYGGIYVDKPTIGDSKNSPTKVHIRNAIEIMYKSEMFFLILSTAILLVLF